MIYKSFFVVLKNFICMNCSDENISNIVLMVPSSYSLDIRKSSDAVVV